MTLTLDDYTYDLPPERIGQTVAEPADSCRLLVCNMRDELVCEDRYFYDLPNVLPPDSVLIFNTSKVIKARLSLSLYHTKENPEKVCHNGEIFFLNMVDNDDAYTFEALVRPWKYFEVGACVVRPETGAEFRVVAITQHGRILRCSTEILPLLEAHGNMPLPPYISYSDDKAPAYQPIFAQHAWSVAAPTASLHFTPKLLERLAAHKIVREEVTLHIWLGTFQSVQTTDITHHDIHRERSIIDQDIFSRLAQHKLQGRKLTAVGTTVTRTLESLPYLWVVWNHIGLFSNIDHNTKAWRDSHTSNISLEEASTIIYTPRSIKQWGVGSIEFSTKLFLYPWRKIYLIDWLITNFHLPKSSLLMLVASFMWFEEMKNAYIHALKNEYMFYSFGDAMYIKT